MEHAKLRCCIFLVTLSKLLQEAVHGLRMQNVFRLYAVNAITNPKVESLTRGDQKYNDPAHGVSGILFTVDYFDRDPLGFRRHNSLLNSRYAVKPMYQRGTGDTLPYCPVIYLGLSRLVPFGEYQNDDAVSNIKKNLPDEYQQEISDIYETVYTLCNFFYKRAKNGRYKDTSGIFERL